MKNSAATDDSLFTDEEVGGTPDEFGGDDETVSAAEAETGESEPPIADPEESVESTEETDEAAGNVSPDLDESKLQAFADQLSSFDDPAMAAIVRGMADESRQALCSAVAGTLSDEQLQQCGLSKGVNMAGGTPDPDEAELQETMAEAKPESMSGGMFMSLNSTNKAKTPEQPHKHSVELARMKGDQLLTRARAVHQKNPAVITVDQLEAIEAQLQGDKCMSLLRDDHGELLPISNLVAMGERMVAGNNDADLLNVKTLNMSLTGSTDNGVAGTAQPAKTPKSGGFDEAEAAKAADERWSGGKATLTTPSMTG